MPTTTPDEIARHDPDEMLAPEPRYEEYYRAACAAGRDVARNKSVAFVAICRNAMPWLPRTLKLVEQTAAMFRDHSVFIFENDSEDATKEVLAAWEADDQTRRSFSATTNGRPHLNFTTAPARTHALAEYRAACQENVREFHSDADYVIVFDTDPWGGWSVDGVANSIIHLDASDECYALASYSWFSHRQPDGRVMPFHYDAFAARLNHWEQRSQDWFHLWHPPVGSFPVPFRSAFGQLAVYRTDAYLAGRYTGEDCEHVMFHKSIYNRFTSSWMGINPSMRCVSFWALDDAG